MRIGAYSMAMVKETLKIGGRLKATQRHLAIGKDRMHTLKDRRVPLSTT